MEFIDIETKRCIFFRKKSTFKQLKKIEKRIRNKNVVLSKEIKEEFHKLDEKQQSKLTYLKQLITFFETNKTIYTDYIEDIIKKVIEKEGSVPEEQTIYFLGKEANSKLKNIINNLKEKHKTINIVTSKIAEFSKLEDEDVIILNNKRKSLKRARFVVNMDFNEEDLQAFSLNRKAIILNVSKENIKDLPGFDGIIINNIILTDKNKFLLQDMYAVDKNYGEKVKKAIEQNEFYFVGNNGQIT